MNQNIPGFKDYSIEQEMVAHDAEQMAASRNERKIREDEEARKAIAERARIKTERKLERKKRWIIFCATLKKRILSGIFIPAVLAIGCLGMGGAILMGDKAQESKKVSQLEKETVTATAGIMFILSVGIILIGLARGAMNHKNYKTRHLYKLMQEIESDYVPYDSVKELKELGKIGLNILKKYSELDSKYLDKLLAGDFSDKFDYQHAIAIIKGCLEAHPEYIDRVLEVYDPLQIPTNIFDDIEQTEETQNAIQKLHDAQTKTVNQKYQLTRPAYM